MYREGLICKCGCSNFLVGCKSRPDSIVLKCNDCKNEYPLAIVSSSRGCIHWCKGEIHFINGDNMLNLFKKYKKNRTQYASLLKCIDAESQDEFFFPQKPGMKIEWEMEIM